MPFAWTMFDHLKLGLKYLTLEKYTCQYVICYGLSSLISLQHSPWGRLSKLFQTYSTSGAHHDTEDGGWDEEELKDAIWEEEIRKEEHEKKQPAKKEKPVAADDDDFAKMI